MELGEVSRLTQKCDYIAKKTGLESERDRVDKTNRKDRAYSLLLHLGEKVEEEDG